MEPHANSQLKNATSRSSEVRGSNFWETERYESLLTVAATFSTAANHFRARRPGDTILGGVAKLSMRTVAGLIGC